MPPLDAATIIRRRNAWIALICVNGAAPVFEIWEYHAGRVNLTGALVSIAFVLVTLNFILIRGLSKREASESQRKTLLKAAGAMALVAFLSTAFGVSIVSRQNDYTRLARSNMPLSSIQPERKRLVVEYLRRLSANSQEEDREMAEARKVPIDPAVYSPESFANRAAIDSTLAQLTKYTQIDFAYSAKQQAAREDFHKKMAACDAEYLKNWDSDRKDQDQLEASAERLEHDWFASANALYSYAEQYVGEIKVTGGVIAIPDAAVRQKFNDLFDQSKALHAKLESTVQEEVKQQQRAKARLGE